jgi:hypothetical protein
MRRMRRISGSFWTDERDERLRRLETQGLSAAMIAERLGTTRDAVLGRSHRLRGLSLTFPWYRRKAREMRAESAARQKERNRSIDAALSKLRQEMARGVERDVAIVHAAQAGATYQAIGDMLGITRQRVWQIFGGR